MGSNPLNIDPSFLSSITDTIKSIVDNVTTNLVDSIANPSTGVGSTPAGKVRRSDVLKQRWLDASLNYQSAPFELSRAEKNYYDYNRGEPGGNEVYNLIIIDRFAKNAKTLRQNSIDKQQEFMADLAQMLKQYQGEKMYADRTIQLLQLRQQENEDLKKKLEMYKRILQTSERKVVYEIKDTTGQHTYRRAMLFLYYSAVISYVIFGNFIPDQLYLNKSIDFILIIVCFIPLILNLIIKWVYIIGDVVAYWFHNRPYKDVYADLKNSDRDQFANNAEKKLPPPLVTPPPIDPLRVRAMME